MITLKELINEAECVFESIPALNIYIYNPKKEIELKEDIKQKLKKIGMIVRRIHLNFPDQSLIINKIIQKRTEINNTLLKNLIQANTNKRFALLYLDNAFHYIPNEKYKFRLKNYFADEICKIYESVTFFDYKKNLKNYHREFVMILKSIYEQNLEDIKATLHNVKANPLSMRNINILYSRLGYKNAFCLYLFAVLLIPVFYFYHEIIDIIKMFFNKK
ncbi:hypothetical protein CDIK_1868 [Cucumispora dikerogammari]|nr:hypothetical protein CDIK_1868 [Cucumispora dikerogammari]